MEESKQINKNDTVRKAMELDKRAKETEINRNGKIAKGVQNHAEWSKRRESTKLVN